MNRIVSYKNASAVLALSVGMLSAPVAYGQEAPEEAQGNAGIAEIIVEARRTAESLQTVPVAVTAITPEEIENRSLVSVQDLQNTTPSLVFQETDAFGAQVAIRGQTQTDVTLVIQPAVGLYIDGVYQSPLASGLIDLYDLGRVEVLKGPQGTLYGRNSTGGAISLYTQAPELGEASGSFRVRGGNYDTIDLAGTVNLPLGDKVAVRLVGQYHDQGDGYSRDLTNNRDLQDLHSESIRGSLYFEPTERFKITLRGDYATGRTGGIYARLREFVPFSAGNFEAAVHYGFITPAQAAAALSAPFDFSPVIAGLTAAREKALAESGPRGAPLDPGRESFQTLENWGASGTVEYELSDEVALKSITAYRRFQTVGASECCDGGPFAVTAPAPQNDTFQKQFTQELQLNGTALDDRLTYTLGGYYYFSDGTDFQQAAILPNIAPIAFGGSFKAITDADVKRKSWAGFGQASFEILPRVRLTAGVRYTKEKTELTSRNRSEFNGFPICEVPVADQIGGQCLGQFNSKFDNWSYTLGADYRPTDNLMIYGRTSTGFKAGGINERGSAQAGTYAPFAPEKVHDYEIGFKSNFLGRRLQLNAAAFYSNYTGLQQTIIVPPLATIISNIDPATGLPNKVTIKGFEVEAIAKPMPELTLRANYGYVDPEYKRGRPAANVEGVLSGVAKHQASASATYEIPTSFGNVTLNGGWTYLSRINFRPDGCLLATPTSCANPDATSQKGYSLFDARIAVNFDEADMTVALFGANLTNKYYYTGAVDLSPALGTTTGLVGTPRTWGIELSKKF